MLETILPTPLKLTNLPENQWLSNWWLQVKFDYFRRVRGENEKTFETATCWFSGMLPSRER